jgi:3',5'-nucleoside bisphosphate phosphatase
MLNIDLHTHSDFSDGVLSPAALAARAKANGVNVWALTDHDEIAGVAQARQLAKEAGIHHVSGVEVSVSWAGTTIHVLGLQVNENNPDLIAGLQRTRAGREPRAREVAAELAKVGIVGAFEGAQKYVSNPDLISRTHFARYIIELGICKKVNEVFHDYLVEGKPGFVPHRWASLAEAVAWIRGADGVAVVAHPGRYKLSDLALAAMLDEFKDLGGRGIEVVTGSHHVEQYAVFASMANRYGFLASVGSDFHAPAESRVDIGKLPALPDNVKPIWHDWF